MEISEKQKIMKGVFSALDYEGIAYSSRRFDTLAVIVEKNFSYKIEILDNGKFCLSSGDDFMNLTYDKIGDLFDIVFFLYHCENK